MSGTGYLALAPEVDELRRQFEQIADDAEALASPLTEAQFHWKPEADAWSIAQCLEHLNAMARHYLPLLDEGIAEAIRKGTYAEGPFEYGWIGRLLTQVLEPPAHFRFKARPHAQPGPERPKRETVSGFRAYQVQYVDRLRQANGIDLASARVRSPVAHWLRIPLGSGFEAMAAHERRHLWQARHVRESAAFPTP